MYRMRASLAVPPSVWQDPLPSAVDRLREAGVLALAAALCILSLLVNGILLETLRRYQAFHDHLRAFAINSVACILLATAIELCATLNAIADRTAMTSGVTPFPAPIALLLAAFSMGAATERFYATINYIHYETLSAKPALIKMAGVVWLPFLIFLWLGGFLSPETTPTPAPPTWSAVFGRHVCPLISGFSMFIFAGVFFLLTRMNRDRNDDYVKHHYRTISTRFQISENIKTCRLLQPLHMVLGVCFFSMFLWDAFNSHKMRNGTVLTRAQTELGACIFPIFAVVYGLQFLYNDSVIKRRSQQMVQSWFHKNEKLLESA